MTTASGANVTLTALDWFTPDVFSIDKASAGSFTPSGSNDFVGDFTLTVVGGTETPGTPEPGALTLALAAGAGGWLLFRRRRS